MKKHNLILLLLILLSLAANANAIGSNSANVTPPASERCELPAPQDFHLVSVGVTNAKYGWTPQVASKHHIETRRTSDNFLLNDTIMPIGATEVTINGLPSSTACYAVIHAVCEDGSDGPGTQISYTTMILDLVVIGFQGGGTSQCTMSGSGQSCPFPSDGNTYVFKVTYGFYSREFGVKFNSTTSRFEFCIGSGNAGEQLKLFCNNSTAVPCSLTNLIIIKFQDTKIAEISAGLQQSGLSKTGIFNAWTLETGAVIDSYSPGNNHSKIKQSGTVLTGNDVNLAPNPFTNALNIALKSPSESNTDIMLLRSDGQLIYTGQIPPGQTDYNIDTATLPTGFYFLRVQSGDQVQVLKVVKSE